MSVRVLLADDENLFRAALAALLALEDDIEVVAQAASGAEAGASGDHRRRMDGGGAHRSRIMAE